MAENFERLKSRRDLALQLIADMPGVSHLSANGAFYVYLDIRRALAKSPAYAHHNSLAFSAKLLEEHHVAMVPGEAFGTPGFLRLSYAAHEDVLREGLQRLTKALAELG